MCCLTGSDGRGESNVPDHGFHQQLIDNSTRHCDTGPVSRTFRFRNSDPMAPRHLCFKRPSLLIMILFTVPVYCLPLARCLKCDQSVLSATIQNRQFRLPSAYETGLTSIDKNTSVCACDTYHHQKHLEDFHCQLFFNLDLFKIFVVA